MIINLFGYEKSVIEFRLLIQFTHLKSGFYKEGKKRYNLHWVNFVESKNLAMKTSQDFHKIFYERFMQEKPLAPGVYLGITF